MSWWCNECEEYHDTTACPGNIRLKANESDGPWIINRVRDPSDVSRVAKLEAENEQLKEELTKKPEWAESDYIEKLEKDIQKLLDEAKGFYDRADKVAGENVRLKNLLREILNNYTMIVDSTGGCIGYDCEFDKVWLQKAKREIE